jgi:5-(carboxyamino)imidazole ribonucleotide mutase
MPKVAVIMGSSSDAATMDATLEVLTAMGIEYEVEVISAHRTPERAREYAQTARERGIEVIIAGAGMAAHLPGVLASWTTLPVIGVPLAGGDLNGLDALYAIVQMPGGIPVATVAIGKAGAKNAGYLAAQMLGLKYANVRDAYDAYRRSLNEGQR